ncbi:hypothetical protein Desmu_0947 [Desulfurococcus mucosus DSM 2162]|uniref:Uncharacterized protein n=1 Tax=Desulfurococcus mucosus (strain ATCC 35584 / DSM 2162 / JCM 9187 / O7/1) TaxID=765177 RepID=E8R9S4_DESM0|nr:hypothetical protein [Desulfurococcus mucosus]ADV65250.1 hypothetical protein Desmu_0947 [Desulfurococcus mucosus DSM 2162]
MKTLIIRYIAIIIEALALTVRAGFWCMLIITHFFALYMTMFIYNYTRLVIALARGRIPLRLAAYIAGSYGKRYLESLGFTLRLTRVEALSRRSVV